MNPKLVLHLLIAALVTASMLSMPVAGQSSPGVTPCTTSDGQPGVQISGLGGPVTQCTALPAAEECEPGQVNNCIPGPGTLGPECEEGQTPTPEAPCRPTTPPLPPPCEAPGVVGTLAECLAALGIAVPPTCTEGQQPSVEAPCVPDVTGILPAACLPPGVVETLEACITALGIAVPPTCAEGQTPSPTAPCIPDPSEAL